MEGRSRERRGRCSPVEAIPISARIEDMPWRVPRGGIDVNRVSVGHDRGDGPRSEEVEGRLDLSRSGSSQTATLVLLVRRRMPSELPRRLIPRPTYIKKGEVRVANTFLYNTEYLDLLVDVLSAQVAATPMRQSSCASRPIGDCGLKFDEHELEYTTNLIGCKSRRIGEHSNKRGGWVDAEWANSTHCCSPTPFPPPTRAWVLSGRRQGWPGCG